MENISLLVLEKKKINFFDSHNLEEVENTEIHCKGGVRQICSNESALFWAQNKNKALVHVVPWNTLEEVNTIVHSDQDGVELTAVAVSYKYVVTGGSDTKVKVWRTDR